VRAKLKTGLVAVAFAGCSVGALTWSASQWWLQYGPRDFEQCSEDVERTASSKDERMALLAQCSKQFAGRRKPDGGYTYYDFLQNRHFDIAGPNPTPKELKYFDEQYTSYLDGQRREAVAADLAERKSRVAQPDFRDDRVAGSVSPPEPPVLTAPTNVPIPRARSSVIRSTDVCGDTSLSCNWTRFSAGIRKFFESKAKVNRP
jgi:hypothetical protein